MAFVLICLIVSLEIQFHVESLSTPDKVWTKLEVPFGKKDDHEECMTKSSKTNPIENPSEEQASQLPPKEYLKYDASFHSNQISNQI
jgi:hypothetical protein